MARVFSQVLMDLDRDGLFETDISADVMQLHVTRGVEVDKFRHPASVCEIQVKNADHKYSPYVTGSLFESYTAPGFPIRVAIGYPYDQFQVTASTFTGRNPTYDAQFTYAGDVTQFEVASAQGRPKANGDYKAVIDFGENDCWLYIKMASLTGTGSGLVFRYSNASNYWMIRDDGANTILTKVVAGVASTVDTGVTAYLAVGLQVLLHGSHIYVFTTAAPYGSFLLMEANDSFNANETSHGIGGNSVNTADRFTAFGGLAPQFYGLMDTVIPHPQPTDKTAYLRCFDLFENLARTQLYWASTPGGTKTTDELLTTLAADLFPLSTLSQALNTAAIIDTDGRRVIKSADTIKSLPGGTVLSALYALQDDEGGGLIYIHEMGGITFESALHRTLAPHTAEVATWYWKRNAGTEADNVIDGKTWEWDAGFDRIENLLHYKYTQISKGSATIEVWRLNNLIAYPDGDRPAIAAGQTLTFVANGTGVGIGTVTAPVTPDDFLINAAEDGSGANLSGSATVTVTSTPPVMGNYRIVSVTNGSGTAGFITFLRVRAQNITNNFPVIARVQDATSVDRYGVRLIEYSAATIDNYADALAAATTRLGIRSEARERVTFDMKNATRSNLMQIAHRRISDNIEIVFTPFGIDAFRYFIEKKDLEVTQGGRLVRCTWTLTRKI